MTISIAVVCEALADRTTITTLAERVIREAAPWIEPETIGDYVEWRGFRRTDSHIEWSALDRHADELKLVIRFSGVHPLHPYSQNSLRAIRVLARSPDRVDAIVMVTDSDDDADRLKGLIQAREYARAPFPIVVGIAHTKRECWHICGYEPEDKVEEELVAQLRQKLGYSPHLQSERLTAEAAKGKHNAKAVLAELTCDNPERESRCISATPLSTLGDRGQSNGLAAFLKELERLLSLFTHKPADHR